MWKNVKPVNRIKKRKNGKVAGKSSIDHNGAISKQKYNYFNEESNKRLGDKSTVETMMYSTELKGKLDHVMQGEIDQLAQEFCQIATSLEKAGADVIVMCTNTMHMVFDQISASVNVPMIHIVDATAKAIQKQGITKVAILGTTFTMTQPFYIERLKNLCGNECVVTEKDAMTKIMQVIEEELTFNIIKQDSKQFYVDVIKSLEQQVAQGVILGCTEIPLLIKQEDTDIPVFDTTYLHAMAALELAMEG